MGQIIFFVGNGKFFLENTQGGKLTYLYFEGKDGDKQILAKPSDPRFRIENLDLQKNVIEGYDINQDASKMLVIVSNTDLEQGNYVFVLDLKNNLQQIGVLKNLNSAYWDILDSDKLYSIEQEKEDSNRKLYEYDFASSDFSKKLLAEANEEYPYLKISTEGRNHRYISLLNFDQKKVIAKNRKTGVQNEVFETNKDKKDSASILEIEGKILYFITGDNYPFGYITESNIQNQDSTNPSFENSKPRPQNIQGSFNNKLKDIVSTSNNLLVANYSNEAFDIVKIFDKEGRFLQELNLPKDASYSLYWNSYTNKLNIYSTSYTQTKKVYEVDLVNNKFEPKVINSSKAHPDLQNIPIKAELKSCQFLNKESLKLGDQTINGIPIVVISKDKESIKVPGQKFILANYAGFNTNNIAPEGTRSPFSIIKAVEEDVIVVIGGARGGSEYGNDWRKVSLDRHEVFEDVLAQITWICDNYENPEISLSGRSNGGLTNLGVYFYTLLNNSDGRYDRQLNAIKKVVVGVPVTDLSELLYSYKTQTSVPWKKEYGDPDDLKQWE
jgi:prolyl oligopeptidase PreP (S9A serine peptidase family)